MATTDIFGLSCALTTPFLANGKIDTASLARHAQICLSEGCSSVTLFGTTGEGASIGMAERIEALQALKQAGINPRSAIIGGVAASSEEEAEAQFRMLSENDCRAILLAPPFYFKGVSDEGLFQWFAGLFDRLGSQTRDVILYNIPSVTAVTLSVQLIERLRKAYPKAIIGVKDSSGDWPYTQELLAAHADLILLIGDERHLAQGVRLGAQGAISGLANVIAPRLLPLVREGREDARIVDLVNEILKYPVTPAVKALVAAKIGDTAWLRARAPLKALSTADAAHVAACHTALFGKEAV